MIRNSNSRTFNELPAAPYKELANEVERRGLDLVGGVAMEGTATVLIGLIDVVRELSEKVEALQTEVYKGYKVREKISKLLQEQFSSVYCDTCAYITSKEHCDDCHRKAMGWALSKFEADDIVDEILEVM